MHKGYMDNYYYDYQESITLPKIAKMFSRYKPNYHNQIYDIDFLLNRICFGFSDCWYWVGGVTTLGYGTIPKWRVAHRFSWHLFNGPIPKGMSVLHKCDIRNCVNPDHLFIGTQNDNVQDMMRKGRHRCVPKLGEDNPMSKLDNEKVAMIREDLERKELSQNKIAKKYSVSPMTISRIKNKQLWSHI